MSTVRLSFTDSVVLTSVTWEDYERWRAAPANQNLRMTYGQGMLEIRSPSRRHERVSYLIGRLIDLWTETRRIPCSAARATTFRRFDLDCGLEPNNCYYLEHEAQVRNHDEIALPADPPPDLAVEVEVKSKVADRLPIYAALGIPELWCWRNEQLQILRLSDQREYVSVERSVALPGFPAEAASEIIARRHAHHDTDLVCEFRARLETR